MVQPFPHKGPPQMWSYVAASRYRSTCIVALPRACPGQQDSGESCIMLQSGPTCCQFPQSSVFTCSKRLLCCRGRTLQMRPWTGVCKTLMPDVVVPKAHQNNRSYVRSADLPLDSHKFSRVGRYTENLEILWNCQNGGGCLRGYGSLPGTIRWSDAKCLLGMPVGMLIGDNCSHIAISDMIFLYQLAQARPHNVLHFLITTEAFSWNVG